MIARNGYTVLDFLSDVGGIQVMLLFVCAFLLSIWNYNHLENFLVQRLYRTKPNSQSAQTRNEKCEGGQKNELYIDEVIDVDEQSSQR